MKCCPTGGRRPASPTPTLHGGSLLTTQCRFVVVVSVPLPSIEKKQDRLPWLNIASTAGYEDIDKVEQGADNQAVKVTFKRKPDTSTPEATRSQAAPVADGSASGVPTQCKPPGPALRRAREAHGFLALRHDHQGGCRGHDH